MSPEYDLEVCAKLQSKSSAATTPTKIMQYSYNSFIIVFAFKSATDYCSLKCDGAARMWSILRSVGGEDFILAESQDNSIKLNVFYNLLIQIRGNSVSIDVDGSPLFTHVRSSDTDTLSGLLGLNAKVRTVFAFIATTPPFTVNMTMPIFKTHPSSFLLHPSSFIFFILFILHPFHPSSFSSFILSSFILLSFILSFILFVLFILHPFHPFHPIHPSSFSSFILFILSSFILLSFILFILHPSSFRAQNS